MSPKLCSLALDETREEVLFSDEEMFIPSLNIIVMGRKGFTENSSQLTGASEPEIVRIKGRITVSF